MVLRTAYLRVVQLVTGVLVAVLLGIHLVIMHLGAILDFFGVNFAEPTSWVSMIGRASQGIFAALYIALLGVGLYHALYGLRNIILETTSSAKIGRIVTRVIIVFGIIFFAGGTYVPVALLAR